jgi:hypothetical protein
VDLVEKDLVPDLDTMEEQSQEIADQKEGSRKLL